MLPKWGYSQIEINQIINCVKRHGGLSVKNPVLPKTIEEKIIWDADLLEKSGIAGLFSSYAVKLENNIPIEEFAKKRAKELKTKIGQFYTTKAKQMDKGGLKDTQKHFEDVIKNCRERKDWVITEKELYK
jgi:hypothetical protein